MDQSLEPTWLHILHPNFPEVPVRQVDEENRLEDRAGDGEDELVSLDSGAVSQLEGDVCVALLVVELSHQGWQEILTLRERRVSVGVMSGHCRPSLQ